MYTSLPLYIGLILCTCLLNTVQAQGYHLYISVNGEPKINNSFYYPLDESNPLTIKCRYDVILKATPPSLIMISSGVIQLLEPMRDVLTLTYIVPAIYRSEERTYKCQTSSNFVQVIVSYGKDPVVTTPPSITVPAPPSNGGRSNFTGLNPLIYTISAVILLGSLAIVSIITCWIRARRSFNNRSLRSAQTAQDYFDHLSDNEFTPLTTAEFQASLQERPPTYIQSEQIEANGGQVEEEEGETASAEPQRTIPPEEAAVIENLIALNLLPEDHIPSQRPRRVRLTALSRGTRQSSSPGQQRTITSQQQQTTQSVDPLTEPSPELDEGIEATERLRSVGARAQLMLNEQRCVGELVSIDSVQPSLECMEEPGDLLTRPVMSDTQPEQMESGAECFSSDFGYMSEPRLDNESSQDT